jgi:CubicO group peptidase (beta-lactamase class C family)
LCRIGKAPWLTKSFTSVAVRLTIADGLLSLEDRMVEVLPDHVPAAISEQGRRITVHHLLSMTAGHGTDSLAEAWRLEPDDLVKGFLRVPFSEPEGTRHTYDDATTFVLARMVERVAGRSLPELLDERMFQPMGVEHAEWDRVASGAAFGFQGVRRQLRTGRATGRPSPLRKRADTRLPSMSEPPPVYLPPDNAGQLLKLRLDAAGRPVAALVSWAEITPGPRGSLVSHEGWLTIGKARAIPGADYKSVERIKEELDTNTADPCAGSTNAAMAVAPEGWPPQVPAPDDGVDWVAAAWSWLQECLPSD